MTAPYSPEVRKRLEALTVAWTPPGRIITNDIYRNRVSDLSAALAHIERLEGALREIKEFTAGAPDDDPLSNVSVLAARALAGADNEQAG